MVLGTVLGVGNRMMSKSEPGAALRSTRSSSEDIQVKRASLKKQPLARDVKEKFQTKAGAKRLRETVFKIEGTAHLRIGVGRECDFFSKLEKVHPDC